MLVIFFRLTNIVIIPALKGGAPFECGALAFARGRRDVPFELLAYTLAMKEH